MSIPGLLALCVGSLVVAPGAGALDCEAGGPECAAALAELVSPVGVNQAAEIGLNYFRRVPEEFTNEAETYTWILLPEKKRARVADAGTLQFPVGTILAKEFSYAVPNDSAQRRACSDRQLVLARSQIERDSVRCLIELRVLWKSEAGWLPYVYAARGTNWEHVPGGASTPLRLMGADPSSAIEFTYFVPSLSECATCHSGLRDRPSFGPIGMTVDRLTTASLERIAPMSAAPHGGGAAPPARAYLNANCGFCHNPNGLASASGLMLDAEESDAFSLGRCKEPLSYSSRSEDLRFVVFPGNPGRSVMVQRMSSLEPSIAMPEQGRYLLDREGIAVVSQWIEQMEGNCD